MVNSTLDLLVYLNRCNSKRNEIHHTPRMSLCDSQRNVRVDRRSLSSFEPKDCHKRDWIPKGTVLNGNNRVPQSTRLLGRTVRPKVQTHLLVSTTGREKPINRKWFYHISLSEFYFGRYRWTETSVYMVNVYKFFWENLSKNFSLLHLK